MEGLRSLLDSIEDLRVVAAENTLEDGRDACGELHPEVVVVDKSFGANRVLEWLRELKASKTGMAMVVWGITLSEAEALRFLQAGAAGVVRKTAILGDLLNCLRTVSGGGSWMEGNLASNAEAPVRRPRSALTAREQQVMEFIEHGYKNKEIAQALGIRIGTVKIHLKHIFEKTGIRGRYGLAISGLKEKGLLALPAA